MTGGYVSEDALFAQSSRDRAAAKPCLWQEHEDGL